MTDSNVASSLFATLLGLFSVVVGLSPPWRGTGAGPAAARAWLRCGPACVRPAAPPLVPHAVAMTFGGTLVGLAHLANLRLNHGHVHDATCMH